MVDLLNLDNVEAFGFHIMLVKQKDPKMNPQNHHLQCHKPSKLYGCFTLALPTSKLPFSFQGLCWSCRLKVRFSPLSNNILTILFQFMLSGFLNFLDVRQLNRWSVPAMKWRLKTLAVPGAPDATKPGSQSPEQMDCATSNLRKKQSSLFLTF